MYTHFQFWLFMNFRFIVRYSMMYSQTGSLLLLTSGVVRKEEEVMCG